MRRINYIWILLAGLLLIGTSCEDFLDQAPESKENADVLFTKPNSVNAYLLGLYNQWRDCHKNKTVFLLGTDEVKVGGVQYRDDQNKRGIEMYSDELSTTNGNALDLWKTRYQIISGATLAIEKIREANLDDETMNRYLAEACALRGACYFELTQFFGEIPLNNAEVVAEYGAKRQPLDLVYQKIEEDLLEAASFLPTHSDTTYVDKQRFGKAFAYAMLGKTFLYAPANSGIRDYAKAGEFFQKVYEDPFFNKTGASKFGVIFDETGQSDGTLDWEKEMIYAFRFSNVRGDNSGSEWDFGSRAVSVMTPIEATAYFAGFDHSMPTAYCYSMKEDGGLWEKGDYRKDLSIRYDFKYNGKMPELIGYCYGDELDPHIKKYEDYRTEEQGLNTWHSGKHMPYIRFADIVLCYAECMYKTGKQAEAIKMVNEKIRARAFQSKPVGSNMWPTSLGEEEFMERMLDERMRELAFEGWRRLDLLRMGKVKELVPQRNTWFLEKGITAVDESRFLFPIPLDELRMNSDMTDADQNPGY